MNQFGFETLMTSLQLDFGRFPAMLSAISLVIWLYLLFARGFFWLGSVRDASQPPVPSKWPAVAIVVPARNEAGLIGSSLRSLLRQNYPGPVMLIVVDDDSGDGTAAAARTPSLA
jgi:cellulose synthase/poly-beta-1,6-N-acetylglucosamine synthase-like glycosyltransferase